METDSLDRSIIALLNSDGQATNKDIAGHLNVSEGTVRNRVRKLKEGGWLRIAGLVNPDNSTGKQLMLLGINISSSRDLSRTAAEIAQLEGVLSAYITAGRYDIIAEVWVDTKGGLIRFLSQTLSSVKGIASTESFLIMKSINKWIAQSDL